MPIISELRKHPEAFTCSQLEVHFCSDAILYLEQCHSHVTNTVCNKNISLLLVLIGFLLPSRDNQTIINALLLCCRRYQCSTAFVERELRSYLQEAPIQLALFADTVPWVMAGCDIKPFWEMVL